MACTRIKICGIRDTQAAWAAVDGGAHAIGLVFVKGSPRYVSQAQARSLIQDLPPLIEVVGLFVDEPVEWVRATAMELGLSTVQLHGHETPAYAQSLRPLRVIKAAGFEPQTAAQTLEAWQGKVSALLWDASPAPKATAEQRGGSGRRFDWEALASLRQPAGRELPIILAGGLTPDNVAQAVRTVQPWAVDVSSGVESHRGVKDPSRIIAFCQAVRQADQSPTS